MLPMASMVPASRLVRALSASHAAALLVALSPLAAADAVSGQAPFRLGLRAGAGLDRTGELAYGAQIELAEPGPSRSVAVAVGYFSGRSEKRYRRTASWGGILDEYRENMRVRGGALLATVLFRDAPGARGPYLVAGLGLGPLQVDWIRQSPTDRRLGSPRPEGGSAVWEERLMLGTVLNVGMGQRLHDRFDVRAQLSTLVVPSTDVREDLELVPTLVLTTGVGL